MVVERTSFADSTKDMVNQNINREASGTGRQVPITSQSVGDAQSLVFQLQKRAQLSCQRWASEMCGPYKPPISMDAHLLLVTEQRN